MGLIRFIKVVLATGLSIFLIFSIFTPLGAILPDFFIDMIPQAYIQKSIYDIFLVDHLIFTIMILFISGLIYAGYYGVDY